MSMTKIVKSLKIYVNEGLLATRIRDIVLCKDDTIYYEGNNHLRSYLLLFSVIVMAFIS